MNTNTTTEGGTLEELMQAVAERMDQRNEDRRTALSKVKAAWASRFGASHVRSLFIESANEKYGPNALPI